MAGWRERVGLVGSRVRRRAADAEFASVLSVADLPGSGWRMTDERAWRTGRVGDDTEWSRRARDAGLLTAWRSFELDQAGRWLWVQVTPFVSDADAASALRAVPGRFLTNVRAEVTVTAGTDVEPLALRGQSAGWAHEQQTEGRGGKGIALYSAFVVDSTLAALAASGFTDSWSWTGLLDLAQIQADRLGGDRA